MAWTEVSGDDTIEEGDRYRVHTCIDAPNVPFSDVYARIVVETDRLTGRVNDELGEGVRVKVVDRELKESEGVVVDGRECDFIYTVTYEVVEVNAQEPVEASIINVAVIAAIAALLLAGAIVVWRVEKLVSVEGEAGESVNNLTTAAVLVAAGYAFQRFREGGFDV